MRKFKSKMKWSQMILTAFLGATITTISDFFIHWEHPIIAAIYYFVTFMVCAYISQLIIKVEK